MAASLMENEAAEMTLNCAPFAAHQVANSVGFRVAASILLLKWGALMENEAAEMTLNCAPAFAAHQVRR